MDLFLAPAVTDFPFAALVRTTHHREAAHIETAASPVSACRTLLARCRLFSSPSAGQTLLLPGWKGREGSFSANRQTQTERELTHLPSLHSLFISPLLSFASFTILTSPFGTLPLHSLRAPQGGGGWWRREGDYDRHGMKVVRRKKEGSGRKIKLLLSELARSVCARRAIWGGRGEKAI